MLPYWRLSDSRLISILETRRNCADDATSGTGRPHADCGLRALAARATRPYCGHVATIRTRIGSSALGRLRGAGSGRGRERVRRGDVEPPTPAAHRVEDRMLAVLAVAVAIVAVLPVFLVGALVVQIHASVGLSPALLGAGV